MSSQKRWTSYIVVIGIGMMFIYGIFLSMQYTQIQNYHIEKRTFTETATGKLVTSYPNEESQIVEALLKKDEDSQKVGAAILAKYGYDESLPFSKDERFVEFVKDSFFSNGIFIFLLIALNLFFLIMMYRKRMESYNCISKQIQNYIDNKYETKEIVYEEGVHNQVNALLYQLGRKQQLIFERLHKEKELLKELVTDISHQVKTPLASLQLYNDLLLDNDLTTDERLAFLQSNRKTIEKLGELSDALLQISRLETAMIQLKEEPVSVKHLLVRSMNSVYPKALQKKIEIVVDDFQDEIVCVDEKWTEECICNVMDNGIKYTKGNGEIRLSVHSLVNFIRIDIQDKGIGIKKENYNDIFKRFYRGEHEVVKESEGSGVGLYLTRKILEEQAGSIVVHSEVGVGTTFSLFLQKCKDN